MRSARGRSNGWRSLAYFSAYAVSRIVPETVGNWIADTASSAAHALKKNERAAVRKNVSLLLRQPQNSPEVKATARKIYRNFGRSCADLLYRTRSAQRPFLRELRIVHPQHLDDALRMNRGVILVGAHTGSWELGAMALASRGYAITALVDEPAAGVSSLYRKQRERLGIRPVSVLGGLIKCVRVLREGGILGVMADRSPGTSGLPADFMGCRLRLPQGAARLADLCGSPIVGAVLRRDAEGKPVLKFWEPILTRQGGVRIRLEDLHQAVAGLLETMIRESPDEWFCFEDVRKSEILEHEPQFLQK